MWGQCEAAAVSGPQGYGRKGMCVRCCPQGAQSIEQHKQAGCPVVAQERDADVAALHDIGGARHNRQSSTDHTGRLGDLHATPMFSFVLKPVGYNRFLSILRNSQKSSAAPLSAGTGTRSRMDGFAKVYREERDNGNRCRAWKGRCWTERPMNLDNDKRTAHCHTFTPHSPFSEEPRRCGVGCPPHAEPR